MKLLGRAFVIDGTTEEAFVEVETTLAEPSVYVPAEVVFFHATGGYTGTAAF